MAHLPSISELPTATLASTVPAAEVAVIAAFKGEEGIELPSTPALDSKGLDKTLRSLLAVGAKGSANEITRLPAPKTSAVDSLLVVGLGDPEELGDETLRRAAGCAAKALKGVSSVALTLSTFGLAATVEGFLLGAYCFRGLRSEEEKNPALKELTFVHPDAKKPGIKQELKTAQIVAESVCFARDLVNTPASHLYPASYAELLSEHSAALPVEVEILNEKQLADKGFGGILAVGQGSARPPRLVRLSYRPSKAKKSVALVGKGITFDTGGVSLKPAANMENMISDMGGSAAAAATVLGAARLGLKVEVTATLPLAENMPSGNATRPGDVITHYGGITSEILNTDAEGRLVLADAIARAAEDDPDYLIDVATLTGAQMVALGAKTSGVMGSEQLRDRIAALGREVGEPAWAMPLLEEQEESIKSPVADIRNLTNSRLGGMEFAALYLSKFVPEDLEWAHLDIAGPAFNDGSASGYTPKRATGVPVRTFLTFLAEVAEEK